MFGAKHFITGMILKIIGIP